jgi:hypothetical protein
MGTSSILMLVRRVNVTMYIELRLRLKLIYDRQSVGQKLIEEQIYFSKAKLYMIKYFINH